MNQSGFGLRRLEIGALLVACAAAEVIVHAAGVRLDGSTLETSWHLLPAEVLRGRLLSGLLHLHSQPPLFNWLVGATIQVAPAHETAALHVLLVACGIAAVLAAAGLARALGAGRSAPLAGLLLLAQPSFLLYEHHLGYEVPLAASLAISGLLLAHAVARRADASRSALLLAGSLTAAASACLLRSLFPLPFFLAAAALAARALGSRRTALAAALPLFALLGWQAKNAAVFGLAGPSSWLGMSLSRMTVERLPLPDRRALLAQGKLSSAALVGGFQPIEAYPKALTAVPPDFAHVPELTLERKRSGADNYNHAGYLAVSKALAADATSVILRRPAAFASAVGAAWMISLQPSSQWRFLAPNESRLYRYSKSWERWLSLEVPLPVRISGQTEVYLSLLFGVPWLFWRALKTFRREPRESPAGATAAFCALCIATVFVLGNTLEVGENNRFHAPLAPLFAALLVAGVASKGTLQPRGP